MSGSMLHVGFIIPTYICFLSIVLCSIVRIKVYNKKKIELTLIGFSAFVIVLLINFIFSASTSFGNYGTVISLGLLTFLVIFYFVSKNVDFKYYLYRVLKFILILSLIGFVLSIFRLGTSTQIGDGFKTITIGYVFYYYWDQAIGPIIFYRNQGIFWEPGILAVYANIFLFLSLFVYKNKKNVWLAVLCVLTTFSTTGFFILLIQLAVFLKKNKLGFLKKIFLSFGVVFVVLILFLSFSDKKNSAEDEAVSSYGMRSFDLYSGFMVAISNPMVGVGLNKEAFFKERNKFIPAEISEIFEVIEERGNSNSIMQLFYTMGLVIAFLTLYMLYKQSFFEEQRGLFFVIMVISLSSEPLLLSPFFMFFVFSVVLFKENAINDAMNNDLLMITDKK
ncbi:hypothetical protein JI750_18350 [Flavobacterium sp. GN10]|uniref:O-Antigen ligase n=1 Tax=Flavobacterium tagetis TaxID=2801336 RepID=A0ABS1KHN2_9FLAO|nr:hypothetical protein [Flavobacterium tagetis]MBL0738863.1 hypothetical protein [Flavobacterium tagetis]